MLRGCGQRRRKACPGVEPGLGRGLRQEVRVERKDAPSCEFPVPGVEPGRPRHLLASCRTRCERSTRLLRRKENKTNEDGSLVRVCGMKSRGQKQRRLSSGSFTLCPYKVEHPS